MKIKVYGMSIEENYVVLTGVKNLTRVESKLNHNGVKFEDGVFENSIKLKFKTIRVIPNDSFIHVGSNSNEFGRILNIHLED